MDVGMDVGMDVAEVHRVLDALDAAGCRAWVLGGWGVDALVGRQTRPHRDLDLAVEAAAESAALAALAAIGYAIETDWRPVRVEVAAPGDRWVDLHPVAFDEHGDGVQAGLDETVYRYPAGCFVPGRIGGRTVGCAAVDLQLRGHSGYELREVDRHDLALLRGLLDR